MDKIALKLEKFNRDLTHARQMKQQKRLEDAQVFYRLAALEMYEIAQMTTEKTIQSARLKKADELMHLADSLVDLKMTKPAIKQVSAKTSPTEQKGVDTKENLFDDLGIPKIGFKDIAGLDELKTIVEEKILGPFNDPEEYEKWGIKRDKLGIFLYGPPGTGKTMVAAAIAHELKSHFLSIKGSDVLRKYQGESEERLSALFKQARSYERSVLFIDEIDSLVPKNSEHEGTQKIRSEILQQVQGIDAYIDPKDSTNKHFLLIAASNKPWDIDPAIIRSGRLGDYHIYIGLPDDAARKFIINHEMEKLLKIGEVTLDQDIDWNEILKMTDGYIVRDIEDMMEEAKNLGRKRFKAHPELGRFLSMEDLISAIQKKSRSVRNEDIQRLIQWRDNGK